MYAYVYNLCFYSHVDHSQPYLVMLQQTHKLKKSTLVVYKCPRNYYVSTTTQDLSTNTNFDAKYFLCHIGYNNYENILNTKNYDQIPLYENVLNTKH